MISRTPNCSLRIERITVSVISFDFFAFVPLSLPFLVLSTLSTDVNNFYVDGIESKYINTDTNDIHFNSWKGTLEDDSSYMGKFYKAVNKFTQEGYPKDKTNTYAMVYMLDLLKIPLKIYARDADGIYFKELNFTTEDILVDGVVEKHFRITICN